MPSDLGGTTAGFSTTGSLPVQDPGSARPPILPTLTILGHPDLERIGERVALGELAAGRTARLSRRQPRFGPPGWAAARPLEDPFLSRQPLRFEPQEDGSVVLSRGTSRTQLAVDGNDVTYQIRLRLADLEWGVVLELAARVTLLFHLRRSTVEAPAEDFGLIGHSEGIDDVRRAIQHLADLDVSVLIRGETGTGKELVARALHDHSPRRDGPFVALNLGALPPSLAAAELFGARKGAYTGAVRDHRGYFHQADGGTLFLDEIGEAPPEIQVMLLRALETGEITAMGDATPRKVDVRVISATDADLEGEIADGRFRATLLHRLAGYSLRIPALRHRREDIGRLAVHFLRREQRRLGEATPEPTGRALWLPSHLSALLVSYPWPGNVRQLRNVCRQLVIDGRGRNTLEASPALADLLVSTPLADEGVRGRELPAVGPMNAPAAPPADSPSQRRKPSTIPETELLDVLRACRFNLKAAAAALGIPRTSLYALVERSPNVRSAADLEAAEIADAHRRCAGDLEAMVLELEVSERGLRQRLRDLGLR